MDENKEQPRVNARKPPPSETKIDKQDGRVKEAANSSDMTDRPGQVRFTQPAATAPTTASRAVRTVVQSLLQVMAALIAGGLAGRARSPRGVPGDSCSVPGEGPGSPGGAGG